MTGATPPPRLLRVDAVTKRFGATEVLRGVSLEVRPGTIRALLGPSGLGSTPVRVGEREAVPIAATRTVASPAATA